MLTNIAKVARHLADRSAIHTQATSQQHDIIHVVHGVLCGAVKGEENGAAALGQALQHGGDLCWV